MPKIRIMIVDDHPIVREGLVSVLKRDEEFEIVGEAPDGRTAVKRAVSLKPDLILMDLRMPEMGGVEAMKEIRAAAPDIKFLVLTTYDTDEHIVGALEAGASGYLLKDAPRDDLFNAIRTVARGDALLQPRVAARLLQHMTGQTQRGNVNNGEEDLSPREIEVLQLVARGYANKEIAARLTITEATVKTHLAHIFQKLGVNDRTEAVTTAVQRNIIRL
ncbi:MAG: response regulator transcription factor [Anaerolineae bacterium]|nr:response regulator transcription factor [Anaerolineae bacterium]